MSRRPDINVLLRAIQAEAECAQRHGGARAFARHIENIQCMVDLIRNRMEDWDVRQHWTRLDRLMGEADPYDGPAWRDAL